jgi:hypothetical protein
MESKETNTDNDVRTLLNEIKMLKEARQWRTINHDVYPDTSIPQGFVLVLDQDEKIYEAELTEFEDEDLVTIYEWYDRDQGYIDGYYGMTHWMTLPDKPKEVTK